MMNRCAYQQKSLGVSGGCGEIRRGDSVSISGVVCPKPRRHGLLNTSCFNDSPIRLPRWHSSSNQQAEVYDSKAGTELFDIILAKGGYGVEKASNTLVPSSPPFFSGSPPCRASNPVIQDAQFGNERLTQVTPFHESSPSSSTRKSGGCVRVKYGQSPTTVRVEGFNCRGISAVA